MTTRTLLSLAIAGAALTAASAQAVTVGNTDFSVGGYLKLDALVTQTSGGQIPTGTGREYYVPSQTPTGVHDESPNFDMHARQTRLFTKTVTKLDNGESIKGYFEIDFMSTTLGDERVTNGYAPELRHAVFTYGNWTMGQTWSTYMDTNVLPDSLDFIGNTDGAVFVRQAQIRYTNGDFQLAVENPQTVVEPAGGATATSARVTTDDNAVPDLVARFNQSGSWGSFSTMVLLRELAYEKYDPTAGTPVVINDSTVGWGFGLNAKVNLSGGDDLRLTANYGEGLGRYVALNTAADAMLTKNVNGHLEALPVLAYAAAYKHNWNAKWRSSVVWSQLLIDNDVAYTGKAVTKSVDSVSVNLIKQVADKLSVGIEARHGNRELESGADGDINRLQFSAKYDL